jgi:hypothetical protein
MRYRNRSAPERLRGPRLHDLPPMRLRGPLAYWRGYGGSWEAARGSAMVSPSDTAVAGTERPANRDALGRFGAGNRAGKGNPYKRRTARLRAEMYRTVTPSDVSRVTKALIDAAASGDVPAIKEFFDRYFGKPEAADVMGRIEELEALILDMAAAANAPRAVPAPAARATA